jgi:alpha-tubulin suppressor-like RCC1 family protein
VLSLTSMMTTIAVGGDHACSLKPDGTTWSWGLGSSGQLGQGSTSGSFTPVNAP